MKQILVVRACAVGDFVLNLPALRALQHRYPGARFTLVGYPSTLELARDFIQVAAIHSIEAEPWTRLFYEPIPGRQFDFAVVWMKDLSVGDNLRRSGVSCVLRADPFPVYGHASTHLLRTLRLPPPELPDLWQPSSDRIVLQPGSGSPQKCWPFFDELASRLPNPFVLPGPAEGASNVLPLPEVARLLRASRVYVGNDSGITHLAGYLGVPTIALFGPTDPRIWGPGGRRCRVVWKRSLSEIPVEDVLHLIRSICGRFFV